MGLKTQIKQDVAAAMKAGDEARRDALRLLLAAIQQAEVDANTSFAEDQVLDVIVKQAKQRRESIEDYTRGGRDDLAGKERQELAVIEAYLPQQMSPEEVRALAAGVIADLGVTDARGMGPVMSRLMAELKGRADGKVVSQVVRDLLQ